MQMVASTIAALAGLVSTHHHPNVWRAGDPVPDHVKSMDFGMYHMMTVGYNEMIERSHFLSLARYGHHALHHMFPTIDNQILFQLDDVFHETCREFNILDLAPMVMEKDPKSATSSYVSRKLTDWEGLMGFLKIVSIILVIYD